MVNENLFTVLDLIKDNVKEHEKKIDSLYAIVAPAPTQINIKVLTLMLDDLFTVIASKRRLNHLRELLLTKAGKDILDNQKDINILETEIEKTKDLVEKARIALNLKPTPDLDSLLDLPELKVEEKVKEEKAGEEKEKVQPIEKVKRKIKK